AVTSDTCAIESHAGMLIWRSAPTFAFAGSSNTARKISCRRSAVSVVMEEQGVSHRPTPRNKNQEYRTGRRACRESAVRLNRRAGRDVLRWIRDSGSRAALEASCWARSPVLRRLAARPESGGDSGVERACHRSQDVDWIGV